MVEHFDNALRGEGLTPIRRQKINEWEEGVHETGARVDDIADLEKILKRAIILRDIAGEDIYNSGKYQRGGDGIRGKVELIVHNGHAWDKNLHFQASRQVHIYEGDVWQAIREATENEPKAVWLLGGGEKRLSVDQFVLQDGRTSRTQDKHDDLTEACSELSNDPEALAEKVFGSTTRPQSLQERKTTGSPLQPPSRMTSRKLVWSMAMVASGTPLNTTPMTSSLST